MTIKYLDSKRFSGVSSAVGDPYVVTTKTRTARTLNIDTHQYLVTGMTFNSDGTKAIVFDRANSGTDGNLDGTETGISEWSFSTGFDVSTASYIRKYDPSSQLGDNVVSGGCMSSDGTKMFVLGRTNKVIYSYTLSTAWNISTASYDSKYLSTTGSGETNPYGVQLNADGTKLYHAGTTGSPFSIQEYTMSTAYDLATASHNDSYSNSNVGYSGIYWNNDGTEFFQWYYSGSFKKFTLSTAYDISSASYDSEVTIEDGTYSGAKFAGIFNDGLSIITVENLTNSYDVSFFNWESLVSDKTTLTNVQDNSIFVETDTAKRYWFSPESTDAENITWDNATLDSFTDSSGTITLSNTSGGWLAKAQSSQTFTSSTGGETVINISAPASGAYLTFGLGKNPYAGSTPSGNEERDTVNFAFVAYSNYLHIKELGVDKYTVGTTWSASDDFKITMSSSGEVKYYVNDVLKYTSLTTASGTFYTHVTGARDGSSATVYGTITQTTPATWARGYFDARGVFCGGYNGSNIDVIDYITISTLGNATDFGDMSVSRRGLGSVANDTRGVFCGGYDTGYSNVMDYITIATTSNSVDFGNSTTSYRSGVVGASSDTRGLFAGGESPKVNIIDYITIATLGNATDFGDLTVARKGGGATSDKTTAVFLGGESGETTMDYVTIATPANAVSFGTMSAGSYGGHCGTISNGTRGVFAIGGSSASGGYNNTIIYITIATPSNATDFGDLTQGRADGGQAGDSTRGVFGGGKTSSGSSNVATTIDYVTIATLGNATDFGDLTVARNSTTGLSDGQ